jgi:hypothetical protein
MGSTLSFLPTKETKKGRLFITTRPLYQFAKWKIPCSLSTSSDTLCLRRLNERTDTVYLSTAFYTKRVKRQPFWVYYMLLPHRQTLQCAFSLNQPSTDRQKNLETCAFSPKPTNRNLNFTTLVWGRSYLRSIICELCKRESKHSLADPPTSDL